jgi:hypothetical protein
MQPRNRRIVVVGVLLLSFVVSAAAAAPIETTVTAGSWYGTTWKLSASASRDGSYCMALTS